MPVDPCGLVVTFRRTCSIDRVKPWADSDETVLIRWYRVPEGTKALPYWHQYNHPDWDPGRPKDEPLPDGMGVYPGGRYDKGAVPDYLGTNGTPCGKEAAWVNAEREVHPPLIYDSITGVSRCCGIPQANRDPLCLIGTVPTDQAIVLMEASTVPDGMVTMYSDDMPDPVVVSPAVDLYLVDSVVPHGSLECEPGVGPDGSLSLDGQISVTGELVLSGGVKDDGLVELEGSAISKDSLLELEGSTFVTDGLVELEGSAFSKDDAVDLEGSTPPGEDLLELDGSTPPGEDLLELDGSTPPGEDLLELDGSTPADDGLVELVGDLPEPAGVTTPCCDSPTPESLLMDISSCSCVSGPAGIEITYDAGGSHGAGWYTDAIPCSGHDLVFFLWCNGTTWQVDMYCDGTFDGGGSGAASSCSPFSWSAFLAALGHCCSSLSPFVHIYAP